TDVGVDVLSFGGTKNGLLGAEAVVFLNGLEPSDIKFVRKQAMQLGSKMRFLAAQCIALLEGDLWRRNAGQANRMARRLAAAVEGIPGLRVSHDVQANVVFATVPGERIEALQAASPFYVWDPSISEVRWMTAWDTTEDDVDRFATSIREILGAPTTDRVGRRA
ncbi:MAG TPA: beta-eliminating lyase-related protein, partial [Candidatus Limnocylindrales bacterium]